MEHNLCSHLCTKMSQPWRIITPLQLGSVSCNGGQVFSIVTLSCRLRPAEVVRSSFLGACINMLQQTWLLLGLSLIFCSKPLVTLYAEKYLIIVFHLFDVCIPCSCDKLCFLLMFSSAVYSSDQLRIAAIVLCNYAAADLTYLCHDCWLYY